MRLCVHFCVYKTRKQTLKFTNDYKNNDIVIWENVVIFQRCKAEVL